jgi:hypothetical protein
MGFYTIRPTDPGDIGLLYPQAQTMDLREELDRILYGHFDQPGVGRPLLVRFLQDQHCVCWDGVTGGPDPGCAYCQGEGFQWYEETRIGYLARNFGSVQNASNVISQQSQLLSYGVSDGQRALAFLRWDAFPNYERYLRPDHPAYDKLYELKVDDAGRLIEPYVRSAKWQIRSVTPHHGDFGRVEFFELGLNKEFV